MVKLLIFYLDRYLDFLDKTPLTLKDEKTPIFKKNNLLTLCLLISLLSACKCAKVLPTAGLCIHQRTCWALPSTTNLS